MVSLICGNEKKKDTNTLIYKKEPDSEKKNKLVTKEEGVEVLDE